MGRVYICPKCEGRSFNSDSCENPSCPNQPCCGKPKELCKCQPSIGYGLPIIVKGYEDRTRFEREYLNTFVASSSPPYLFYSMDVCRHADSFLSFVVCKIEGGVIKVIDSNTRRMGMGSKSLFNDMVQELAKHYNVPPEHLKEL